jgi:O-antigen ligase
MRNAVPTPPLESQRPPWLRLSLLWVLMAASSIVLWEPAPYEFIAVLLIGATIVSGVRIPAALGPAAVCLTLFTLSSLISMVNVKNQDMATVFFGITFYLILTFFLFATMVHEDPKHALATIWHGWIVGAVIAVTLGLMGYFEFSQFFTLFTEAGRASGSFKDPNVYGPYLVPVILYVMAGMKGLKQGLSPRKAALLLYLCIGILIGFSRGAWANLIAAAIAFVGLKLMTARSIAEFRNMLMSSAMISFVVTVVVLVLIANTQVGADFSERAQINQYYDEGTGGRWENMYAALLLALKSPLGIGPGQSTLYLIQEPHNLFLQVFVQKGWLGLLSFAAFLGISFTRFLRLAMIPNPAQQTAQILCASLVGLLVNTIVIDPLHWRHMYLILGMGWGLVAAYPVPTFRERQRQMLVGRRKAIAASRLGAEAGGPQGPGRRNVP